MIERAGAEAAVARKLEGLDRGHCLDVRSYKRNRSVVLVKLGQGEYLLLERGFERKDREVKGAQALRKALKVVFRREFPRSTKLRVYSLGHFDPKAETGPDRKTI